MFKYLILCASLILALPSYATELFLTTLSEGTCGVLTMSQVPISTPLDGSVKKTGEMSLKFNYVELSASVDNPGLRTIELTSGVYTCNTLAGFKTGTLNLPDLEDYLIKVGTFEITRNTWLTGGYFDIGNGLAIKIEAADNNSTQLTPVTQGAPIVTYNSVGDAGRKILGLKLKGTLKVIGDVVIEPGMRTFEIGKLSYTLTDRKNRTQTAYAPVSVGIQVTQAELRSCTLQQPEFDSFDLQPAQKNFLDAGWEVDGGSITLGPVVCPPKVDVKVSFFDNDPNAVPESNYLRTVYIDDETPSQYALKLYPTGSGNPLLFLPVGQLKTGWNAEANATTIDFTGETATGSSVQKDYAVKYVKVAGVGSDRPGPIKGIMTVQFLYY